MASYSAAARHRHTMQVLKEHGHASVSKLSAQLGVSEVTIRKDLRVLEERDSLVRTHGGAILADHFEYDLPFDEKSRHQADEKSRIGERAASLVSNGDTVLLNAGSTTVQVARHLKGKQNLVIGTNAVYVALELLTNLDVDVLMLGGVLHPATGAVVGPDTEVMLSQRQFDFLFLAGDGFDLEHGVTTTNVLEAHLSKAMIRAAHKTVAVMDHSKFGRRGLTQVCGPGEVDAVVTDDQVNPGVVEGLERLGIDLFTA